MKICLIHNLYPPYTFGGAERVVENIVQGLKNKGHNVFVVSTKPFGKFQAPNSTPYLIRDQINSNPETSSGQIPNLSRLRLELRPRGGQSRDSKIKIYRFFPINFFWYGNINKYPIILRFIWRIIDIFNFYTFFKIKKILKKEKPEIVHTHNLTGLSYLIPRLIKKLRIKHIHTLHDLQLIYPSGLLIKNHESDFLNTFFLQKWYEKLSKFLFNTPQIVISPSKWLLGFYESRGFFKQSKKVVLPNPVNKFFRRNPEGFFGIPSGQINSKSQISPPEADPPLTENLKINFLYCGQIERHKGILFLIETFKKFITSYQSPVNSYLHIIGDGSLLKKVKEITQKDKRIKFYGKEDQDRISIFYQLTDITVVPSLCYENSPAVIYESLSYGLPLIASRLGGIPEIIKDEINGWTFTAGNEKELINLMERVVRDKEKIKRMGKACQKSVAEYRIEKYIKKLAEIYLTP